MNRISGDTLALTKRDDLWVRKSIGQHIKPGSMLWMVFNLSTKMRDWIELKAEEKSMN